MPTVLRVGAYRFFFFAADQNEPAHVHVEHDDCHAKFWLSPVRLATNGGFRAHELREIATITAENEVILVERWNEFFSR